MRVGMRAIHAEMPAQKRAVSDVVERQLGIDSADVRQIVVVIVPDKDADRLAVARGDQVDVGCAGDAVGENGRQAAARRCLRL